MKFIQIAILILLVGSLSVALAKNFVYGQRVPGDYRFFKHPIKYLGNSKDVTGTNGTFVVEGDLYITCVKLIDKSKEKTCKVSIDRYNLKNVTFIFEDPQGNDIDYLANIYVKNL